MMRVLAINSDVALAAQLQRCLSGQVEILWQCDTLDQGLALLSRQHVDIVLIHAGVGDGWQQSLIAAPGDWPVVVLLPSGADREEAIPWPGQWLYVSLPLADQALLQAMSPWLAAQAQKLRAVENTAIEPESLRLTCSERRLLMTLIAAKGRVVSKARLYPQVLSRPYGRHDRSLDLHVSHLRRKLRDAGISAESLQTVWGKGYSWSGPDWQDWLGEWEDG